MGRKDQNIRSKAIVKHMLATEQRTLRTMDGAGRFVYSFLKVLSKRGENLDEWTIELFDTDPLVHHWHTLFMPVSSTNRHENILDHPDDEGFHSGTLVYFNFCGLGDSVLQVQRTLTRFHKSDHETFVSWSVRGISKEVKTKARGFIKWIGEKNNGNGRGEYIVKRGNFYTYKVKKSSVTRREFAEETERVKEKDKKLMKNVPKRKRKIRSMSDKKYKAKKSRDKIMKKRIKREEKRNRKENGRT